MHADGFCVRDFDPGRCGRAALLVLVDADDDRPARCVREGSDVASEVPLGLVVRAVLLDLEVEVECLLGPGADEPLDMLGQKAANGRPEECLKAPGTEGEVLASIRNCGQGRPLVGA